MRLIDADAFIEFLKETSKKLEFDKIEFKDSSLTAQAIIDGVIADLDGTSLDGFENAPTIEPERKKGKWIEVHGYVTPGGDPVWKCSECGKGMHVYGIEAPSYNRDYADGQWVACPNCGAEMTRGE